MDCIFLSEDLNERAFFYFQKTVFQIQKVSFAATIFYMIQHLESHSKNDRFNLSVDSLPRSLAPDIIILLKETQPQNGGRLDATPV